MKTKSEIAVAIYRATDTKRIIRLQIRYSILNLRDQRQYAGHVKECRCRFCGELKAELRAALASLKA